VKQAGIRRGQVLTAAAAAFVIAGGLLTWQFWPSAQRIPGAERVRQYTNVRACMLTGADGVADSVAAAAWAGMQGASASSRAMVSYLPVTGPGGKATALPYLASLVQRQCGVIVAVGPAQVAAATSQAARYRQVHFIVVTQGQPGPPTSGVVRIAAAPAAQVHSAVQAAVSAAVNG
jgi:basic membrane lipoprotein Med (substrate-binding protein (PBP1-ABC) superfamily)